MKNIFQEKKKRQIWWDKRTKEEQYELLTAFRQIHGGEVDDELKEWVLDDFINKGKISIGFMEHLLKTIKSGNQFILNAH